MSGDRGAIAVLTAILAFLLFGVSALAVDLGKMYARSGDAQRAVDLAALAGASALVEDTDDRSDFNAARARQAAHTALVQNAVHSDGSGFGLPPVGDFNDDNPANGEIDIDTGAMQVSVLLPPRTVHFGLAAIFGVGQSSVTARAVAEVRTPAPVLPFYLPDRPECRTGPQIMTLPPDEPDEDDYEFRPTDSTRPDAPIVNPGILALPPSGRITIIGDRFTPNGMRVQFVLGEREEFADDDDIEDVDIDPTGDDAVTVRVPSPVRNTPGDWAIRVSTPLGGWGGGPVNPAAVDLQDLLVLPVPTSVINECGENPAGDLGLFTPNAGESDLTLNLINGLSEELSVGDEVTISAGTTVDEATDGLIRGSGSLDGRLTTGSPECHGTTTVLGYIINNDKLSCFLHNPPGHGNHNLGTLLDDCDSYPGNENPHEGPALKPSIFDSPRFFFVPVLDVDVNSPGTDEAEVTEFRAVFLTGQTSGGPGQTDQTAPGNGLSVEDGELDRIQVFAFCPDELPNAAEEGGNGFPWQPGLPTAIRLVQ